MELVFKQLQEDFHVGDEAQVEGASVLQNGGTPLEAGKAAAMFCCRSLPPHSVAAVVAAVLGMCEGTKRW